MGRRFESFGADVIHSFCDQLAREKGGMPSSLEKVAPGARYIEVQCKGPRIYCAVIV